MTTPDNFLGLPDELQRTLTAQSVLILPIPFEATVSYGGGTAAAGGAIIAASQQVNCTTASLTVSRRWSMAYIRCRRSSCRTTRRPPWPRSRRAVAGRRRSRQAAGRAGRRTHDQRRLWPWPVATPWGPAHRRADRRAQRPARQYEGTPYSHACVARRLLEDGPRIEQVLQLGIRSVCPRRGRPLCAQQPQSGARLVRRSRCTTGGWHRRVAPARARAARLSHHRRGRAGPGDCAGHRHAGAGRSDLERDAATSAHAGRRQRHGSWHRLRRTGAGAGLHTADFAVPSSSTRPSHTHQHKPRSRQRRARSRPSSSPLVQFARPRATDMSLVQCVTSPRVDRYESARPDSHATCEASSIVQFARRVQGWIGRMASPSHTGCDLEERTMNTPTMSKPSSNTTTATSTRRAGRCR
jgi:hypothetical protein